MDSQQGKTHEGEALDDSSHSTVVDVQEDRGKRTRTLTEKGREWQLQQLKGKFRSAVTRWQKQSNSLSILMSDTCDCQVIRDGRSKLDKCFEELCLVFDQICELQDEWYLSEKFESISNEHKNLMLQISEAVRSLESEKGSVRSARQSVASHASKISKLSFAAEAASLEVKLKYLDMEAKTKAELERLDIMKRLDMATAKLNAISVTEQASNLSEAGDLPDEQVDKTTLVKNYISSQVMTNFPDDPPPLRQEAESRGLNVGPHQSKIKDTNPGMNTIVSNSNPLVSQQVPLDTKAGVLNPVAQAFVPQGFHAVDSESVKLQQGLLDLTKSLADQVSLNRLPPPEPTKFYGDPIQYPAWKVAFRTLIEQRNLPDGEKIHYLKRYLGGSVLQVVENYFLLSSEDAFEEAKKLLDERFGDPFVIAGAFRDKLESWPKINAKDAHGLQKFSDFLKQCLAATSQYSSLAILNDCRENRKMLSKLPDWLVSRWNRAVAQSKDSKGEFPPFKDFVEFVGKEARIANDPVTSVQALKPVTEESRGTLGRGLHRYPQKAENKPVGGRTLLTSQNPSRSLNNSAKVDVTCPFCKKSHELDQCSTFVAKTLDERKAFIREKKLCFACLKGNHISKDCKRRKRCEKCHKFHPTCLHGDTFPKQEPTGAANSAADQSKGWKESISHMSTVGTCRLSSMILPVYVSHDDHPSDERLVYALLDTQSDTTFVLEETCKSLGVSGVDVDLLLSTMFAENSCVKSQRVRGLSVRGFNNFKKLSLPSAYTRQIMPANRSHIPTPEMARKWPYLVPIAEELLPLQDCEVSLLIGYNCAQALVPREIIAPDTNGPYAQKTDLGWGIVGVVDGEDDCVDLDSVGVSHRIIVCEVQPPLVPKGTSPCTDKVLISLRNKVKEVINPADILRMMDIDFVEQNGNRVSLSVEDQQFMDIVTKGIERVDGHYQMPLPLKGEEVCLPRNKTLALNRLNTLKVRLEKNKQYQEDYCSFMQEMISKGYAEKIPNSEVDRDDGKVWYIPHHGVYHPKKPDKIRVVFDCSAKFAGESLNSHLLQGPDLTNKLVGVICRFRREMVAVMCDIEKMFFQFRVNPCQRDFLRFLWWESRDFNAKPVEYRMCVHLFGAVSSPGCANYGLKQIALDNEEELGKDVANFVRQDFYVDDGLTSVRTDEKAVQLVRKSKKMCSKGGLRLHKFLSNSKHVLQQIAPEDRAKGFEDIDLLHDTLPVERALGVQWCIESDCLQFRITLSDRPLTRRGALSTVTSIYDPLGFISPVVLVGKQVLQQLCADQVDWDSPIPEYLRAKWEQWRNDLHYLESLKIRRCFKPDNFGEVVSTELHHFSDASQTGYGQCSYVRLVDDQQRIHCSLVMSKARVAPLKPVTVPRLELTAALVSVRVSSLLNQELHFKDATNWFWTDSKVVLGYLANDSRRFHVYVANRVQQIHDQTVKKQWRHVVSKQNPADMASRGSTANEFIKDSMWLHGPEFLWKESVASPAAEIPSLSSDDPEVKRSLSFKTKVEVGLPPSLCERFERVSSWTRLKVVVALCLRFVRNLKRCVSERKLSVENTGSRNLLEKNPVILSVQELVDAEKVIVRVSQQETFAEEIRLLKNAENSLSRQPSAERHKSVLKGHSSIFRLDPFLDSENLLRVGGRLNRSPMNMQFKHPIVLPKNGHVTKLVVRHFHERTGHQGRGMTSNEIRSNGFWIIGLSSVVSSLIWRCVSCRRMRGSTQIQKMSDLPEDRVEPAPPFAYTGVDYFGPWYVKEGRKELKRYGVIFTCLCCRAVHLETANTLNTDSFINALRRFLSIRGPVRELRSDRGTNFVGAKRELEEAVSEMDEARIKQFLVNEGCDYIVFRMNVPSASHMGGIWERQIRSVRNVLACLLHQHGTQLCDEELRTLLCEAAAIVNSRPLAVQNVNDPLSLEPLTPNHLLTMKSKIVLSPPGQFQSTDMYARKRWRRIQFLANEFWSRWKKEYLQNLQVRSKWVKPKRNCKIGDVVLISDDNLPRSQWSVGKIVEANAGDDGLVRKVTVMVGTRSLDERGKRCESLSYLQRPIHKLVLLSETE